MRAFIAAMALVAIASIALNVAIYGPVNQTGELAALLLFALLLDSPVRQMRHNASGSLVFVASFASVMLLGGVAAIVVVASSALISQGIARRPVSRIIFNVSQLVASIALGAAVYAGLGGAPLSGGGASSQLAPSAFWHLIAPFFGLALTYFAVNQVAVSTVVALNSQRRFTDVWHANQRGVLVFDAASSLVSALVVWAVVFAKQSMGIGALGMVLALPALLAVRRAYNVYREMEGSGRDLLSLMVKAIEARDPYTSGHSVRVRAIAGSVAAALDLPAAELEDVETAALLHDVGKIHAEFAPLLAKAEPLTPAEQVVMRTHVEKSAALVSTMSRFRGRITESVLHHHERWDGTGYPSHLKGTAIPLGARIIAVADALDAMMTSRPYKRSSTPAEAIEELRAGAGYHFDPEIVAAVVSSERVLAMLEQLSRDTMPTELLAPEPAQPPPLSISAPQRRWRSPRRLA
ncbi:MAG: HD-GYP domain-containing protein [Gemmatimonadales bacterium]|nr:HD-GYP domain-containing protein [Gemmatimonadales bacterium]